MPVTVAHSTSVTVTRVTSVTGEPPSWSGRPLAAADVWGHSETRPTALW
jgi:hypothetical protein